MRGVAPGLGAIGRRPPGQHAQILHAVLRGRENRLEQQVEQQVVAPDVDDERFGGPDAGDVGEILVGADADIDAARDAGLFERGHDVQVRLLVGNQVVGIELAVGLRELLDQRGERRLRGLTCDARAPAACSSPR